MNSIIKKILRILGFGRPGGLDDIIGHEIEALIVEAEAKFPVISENIRQGIAALKDEDMPGGEKAVKVAVEVLQTAPVVLARLPDAKAFFVSWVTREYAKGLDELREAANDLLGRL